MTYGSCQSRCESKVQTWLNPCCSASRASATVRDAGGLVCRTAPNSISPPSPLAAGATRSARGKQSPRGGRFARGEHGASWRASDEVLREAALDVAPVALGADVVAGVDDHLAPGEHGVDMAVDLEALPRAVIHVHVMGRVHPDGGVAVRVVDHDVGVGTRL